MRVRPVIYAILEALCRVLFTYDCAGEEHVPRTGPAVVASNHPSYLDPIVLSLQLPRSIRFMAYKGLFKIPVLASILRFFGAFPVDIRPGHGREAYAQAKELVEAGEVVGIFPEGRRSRTGWMEPALREGAARLAWETGAPLVPATITGAFRAWPHFRALPTPARVRVRFHAPIDPKTFRAQPEEQALASLLAELRRRVERSLLPGVKADLRTAVVYLGPAPRPRVHELAAALAYAAPMWPAAGPAAAVLPALAYLAYLAADVKLIPQSRFVKRLRNASALVFSLVGAWLVARAFGLPLAAPAALAAVLAGAWLPHLYERGQIAVGFVRGGVVACVLAVGALALAPLPAGPHIALCAYAAAYSWDRRTIFWRYAVPVLVVYAVAVALTMGGGRGLAWHAAAGLLGWLVTRWIPYHRAPGAPPGAPIVGSATTRPRTQSGEPTT
jgi:1-acyl-sn-glycerol-3-phosphate acyltransferase